MLNNVFQECQQRYVDKLQLCIPQLKFKASKCNCAMLSAALLTLCQRCHYSGYLNKTGPPAGRQFITRPLRKPPLPPHGTDEQQTFPRLTAAGRNMALQKRVPHFSQHFKARAAPDVNLPLSAGVQWQRRAGVDR